MNSFVKSVLVPTLIVSAAIACFAQRPAAPDNAVTRDIDAELAAFINSTPAIDNHAHPVLPGVPGNPNPDRNFDALPVDNMEPETDITAWTPANPQLLQAWQALWHFAPAALPGSGPDATAMKQLEAARNVVRSREGANYAKWVLDQAGIGTMVANRVTLGPGIAEPRFRWVPYDDALLFPLDNAALAAATPDKALFFPLEDKLRGSYLAASGLAAVPPTLDEYLSRVVTPTLEGQKAGGAIAVKFEVAYLRDFDFTAVGEDDAGGIYAALYASHPPEAKLYKQLQDFLFHYIAAECGRLHLAVHLHTMSGGGGYFSIAGANPLLLEPIFNDPSLRRTNFVMLHGGWPFVREAGALLQKPNVFLDLSQQSLSFPPRTLAIWLREWLETFPSKVLFGTDGYPFSDSLGWEEATWIAAHNARQSLGLALTGMLRDGEISRARAHQIAAEVLRGNAAALYHLP